MEYKASESNMAYNEKNMELCRLIQNGTEEEKKVASEELIRLNTPLLKKEVGRMYPMYSEVPTFDEDDAFQEACMGLLHAAEKYDCSQSSFSTYAVTWIRQKIGRECDNNLGVSRIPSHSVTVYRKARRAADRSLNESAFLDYIKNSDMYSESEKQSIRLVSDFKYVSSINRIVGNSDDDGCEFGELILTEEKADESINRIACRMAIKEALGELTEKERWVIEHRFGFKTSWTLSECGDRMPGGKVTRERVRQIENGAIKKLSQKAARLGLDAFREAN